MTDAGAAAIDIRGLAKRYADSVVLAGLDLAVRPGECFGLLGANGAGKSTAIQVLATLLQPDAGSAVVAGHDVVRAPVAARGALGVVFQDSALDRGMSAAENLHFAAALHLLPRALAAQRIAETLELFELGGRAGTPVGQLSGGQRRALDVARGVLHRPAVLILDEPTAGLDLANRRALWRFIARLRAAHGMTVLVSTHLMDEAADCDRVAFLRAGRVAGGGTPAELVAGLGAHLLAVSGAGDTAALVARFGAGLADGETTVFRVADPAFTLAELAPALLAPFRAVQLRRPELGDVHLWLGREAQATAIGMEDAGTRGHALDGGGTKLPSASASGALQIDCAALRPDQAAPAPLAVAFAAIIVRDLRRTWRQRGRLLSALVRPLLWLVVIGGGVEGLIGRGGQAGYRGFLAPGLLAMALLFGGMFASLSLVLDKESGVLRMLLLAPFSHAWIVLARLLSSAAVGLLQATLLLAVLAACGYLGGCDVALLAVGLVSTALAAAAMGMLLAVWVRSLENFSVMVNVVIFPLFFLSGALYPVQGLPPSLRWAAQLNPFSYGVDLLKHAAGSLVPPFAPDFSIAGDLAVLAGFTVAATALACWRFSRRGTIAAFVRLVAR